MTCGHVTGGATHSALGLQTWSAHGTTEGAPRDARVTSRGASVSSAVTSPAERPGSGKPRDTMLRRDAS